MSSVNPNKLQLISVSIGQLPLPKYFKPSSPKQLNSIYYRINISLIQIAWPNLLYSDAALIVNSIPIYLNPNILRISLDINCQLARDRCIHPYIAIQFRSAKRGDTQVHIFEVGPFSYAYVEAAFITYFIISSHQIQEYLIVSM